VAEDQSENRKFVRSNPDFPWDDSDRALPVSCLVTFTNTVSSQFGILSVSEDSDAAIFFVVSEGVINHFFVLPFWAVWGERILSTQGVSSIVIPRSSKKQQKSVKTLGAWGSFKS
jgi:hypothetical protein